MLRLVMHGFALVLRYWWSALSAFCSDLLQLFVGVYLGGEVSKDCGDSPLM